MNQQTLEPVARRSTSVIIHAMLLNTSGAPMTGITASSTGLLCRMTYPGASVIYPIPVSLEDVQTGVGLYDAPTDSTHMKFYEVDLDGLGSIPGLYEFHLPNEWLNPVTPYRAIEISLYGVENMEPARITFPLTGVDLNNSETAGIAAIIPEAAEAAETMTVPGGRPLLFPRMCRWFDSASAIWYVSATGNDASSGLSQSLAFATIEKAVSEAAAGDIIILGAGTFPATTTIAPAAGITFIGAGKTQTIITCPTRAISGGAGGVKMVHLSVEGGTSTPGGDAVYSLREFQAWSCRFIGHGDIIVPTEGHCELVDCELVSSGYGQDGFTSVGGTTDLYNCTIDVSTTAEINPSSALRAGAGSIVRMFCGSITSTANSEIVNGVQANSGGVVILVGVSITTPEGKIDVTDSTVGSSDHTGRVFVDPTTSYSPGKVSGSLTVLPALESGTIDGKPMHSVIEGLLAFTGGKSTFTDNGDGTGTVKFKKQDGLSDKLTITYSLTTGARLSAVMG